MELILELSYKKVDVDTNFFLSKFIKIQTRSQKLLKLNCKCKWELIWRPIFALDDL